MAKITAGTQANKDAEVRSGITVKIDGKEIGLTKDVIEKLYATMHPEAHKDAPVGEVKQGRKAKISYTGNPTEYAKAYAQANKGTWKECKRAVHAELKDNTPFTLEFARTLKAAFKDGRSLYWKKQLAENKA